MARLSPSGPVLPSAAVEIPSCSIQLEGMSTDGNNEARMTLYLTGYGFNVVNNPAGGADPDTRAQVPSAGRYEIVFTGYAKNSANVATTFSMVKALNGSIQNSNWLIPNVAAPNSQFIPLSFSTMTDILDPEGETIYLSCPNNTTTLYGVMTIKRIGPIPAVGP